ncbi:MAG TPA: hypothetical protein VIA18_02050 [Polyangia bacterium]|nr:hypothetical protein [Polyangia bacterium]
MRDDGGSVAVDLGAARVDGGARYDVRGTTSSVGPFERNLSPRLAAFLREHDVDLGAGVLGRVV